MTKSPVKLPPPVYNDEKHHIRLYQGDCLELLSLIPESSVDLIFADPPYFLSNGGITCHAGRMVSVNKGAWDKSRGPDANHEFNRAWLAACQRILKPNGSLWVSGTAHVIHSVGFAMQQLAFKLLNDISWVKPNPPPNLSCRYFTHATETIIWAARDRKSRHTFNYKLMKETNRGKQTKKFEEIPCIIFKIVILYQLARRQRAFQPELVYRECDTRLDCNPVFDSYLIASAP